MSGFDLNAYTYVLNNPLAYVDPTGLSESDGPQSAAGEIWITVYAPGAQPLPPPTEGEKSQANAELERFLIYDAARSQPVDVGRVGHSGGAVASPKASPEQDGGFWSGLVLLGQTNLGVLDGVDELSNEFAVSTVVNFSALGPIALGFSLLEGYEDGGGILGAINVFNPLNQIGIAGANAYMASSKGDYRAAAAASAKGAILLAATVMGARSALGAARGAVGRGAGGGAGITRLFRAVMRGELSDIAARGGFRNPAGLEVKYFSTSAEGAASYARQAAGAWGDGPFTIVESSIESSRITPLMRVAVDRGIQAIVIPTESLGALAPPTQWSYTPTP